MTWREPAPIVRLRERVSSLLLAGQQAQADAIMAEACLAKPYGLWVLLRYGLGRKDAHNQWVFDRCCEVQAAPDGYLDLWAREHFKMLRLDEPVATPTGWAKHGDLKPGDEVFSPMGKPIKVLARTEVFTDGPAYEIEFDCGAKIRAGADHKWQVERRTRKRIPKAWNKPGPKRIYRESVTLTTEEISRHDHSQDKRLAVALAEPLQMADADLPIDPYTLGAWLGDGTSKTGDITCGDPEVFDRIGSKSEVGHDKAPARNAECRRVVGLHAALKGAGLTGNKHIPLEYMRGSVEQRLELLRGLMDTDGHCDTRGTATFANTNEDLVDGVVELVRTLGIVPYKRRVESTYAGAPYVFWQVSFQAYSDLCPFHIKRKAAKCRAGSMPNRRRFIVACKPIAPEPMSCIQVEGGLYLAGRELIPTHNSSIITVALSIQDILRDPEITIGIFSHTRPIAKAFLRQIKQEFENNERLKRWFPEVLWGDPVKESPKWSEDEGIIVRRKGNPKEATVEAWGLVDGQPTSKHFAVLNYDDVVTENSVGTPEMMKKTTRALENSFNLGRRGGVRRFVGTRYHYADSYRALLDRKAAKARLYPATVDGTVDGEPVFLTREELAKKRSDQGQYTYGCQMLLDPTADAKQGFREEWLRYAVASTRGHNLVILCDPASGRKKNNDYTAMWCLGLGPDRKVYAHDILRDRLSLTERAERLMAWHRKYRPMAVAYEQYGMMADIEHIRHLQERENYRFDIYPAGGAMAKPDRIRRLVPWFEQGRVLIPPSLVKTDYEGRRTDLVRAFIDEEFRAFPVAAHDDMLDALSRFLDEDLPIAWPAPLEEEEEEFVEEGRNPVTGY